jgi:hypothetical protein
MGGNVRTFPPHLFLRAHRVHDRYYTVFEIYHTRYFKYYEDGVFVWGMMVKGVCANWLGIFLALL